ncbi:hypothetical protein NQ318_006156 [Aromia moschata]|uniref:Intracellular hyaluronan-binding protein 4 N-terminal domain-containing protein n=1 Tax=Aromia moschata TaxID=1265417 RepID=A0AAV8XNQ2_9CUCU|nr:hypothetical protein NQ318_006156 [Aromia moschata]
MENTYGIGVANRYALFLDDESDPLETLSLKEQEKELKKKSKVAEKENKVKTETPAKGKPQTAQKKTVKDNIHKAQENKRDDSKQTHPRSNADGKPDRERNLTNLIMKTGEERNNKRNREDRPYNGPTENRIARIGLGENRLGRILRTVIVTEVIKLTVEKAELLETNQADPVVLGEL